MADFKLQLVFWANTDMAWAAGVQIKKRQSELCLAKQFV